MTHPRPRPRAPHATPWLAFLTEEGARCDGQFSTRHREAQDVKGVPPAYTEALGVRPHPHHEAQDRRGAPGIISHSAMGRIGGISPYRLSTVPGKITHWRHRSLIRDQFFDKHDDLSCVLKLEVFCSCLVLHTLNHSAIYRSD